MYLKNLKTGEPRAFAYNLSYDSVNRALLFGINPLCVKLLEQVNPENNLLAYCKKLGYTEFESDITKNFGFNNCSINHGIIDGLLTLSFPVKVTYTMLDTVCNACDGKKKTFGDTDCFSCRETGKELNRVSNVGPICASLYPLTKYLNWMCLLEDNQEDSTNNFGYQDIFLECDAVAGIGGEFSAQLVKSIATEDDLNRLQREEVMFQLYLYIDGKEDFPKCDFYHKAHNFRNEIGERGGVYVEVPGVNGCSIHNDSFSAEEFTCHNIDRPQQQLCLLVGLAMITGEFYKKTKSRPPI